MVSLHREGSPPSRPEKPRKGKGGDWLKRATLLAGLALTPSGGLKTQAPEHSFQNQRHRVAAEKDDRERAAAARERIAAYATRATGRPGLSGDQTMPQTPADPTVERTSEQISGEAGTVGHDAVSSLYNPQNSAPHNFDDIGTRIRTQAQDRLAHEWTSHEVSAFVKSATTAAYQDLTREMESLRAGGRGRFADELYVMFNSWDPSSPETPAETVVNEDGSRMEVASGRIIQLPTGTEEEE